MTDMTTNFPPSLEDWIAIRIAEGRYSDTGDYLRDLVRRDQEGLLPGGENDAAWVREQVDIGLASGVCDEDAFAALDTIAKSRV